MQYTDTCKTILLQPAPMSLLQSFSSFSQAWGKVKRDEPIPQKSLQFSPLVLATCKRDHGHLVGVPENVVQDQASCSTKCSKY